MDMGGRGACRVDVFDATQVGFDHQLTLESLCAMLLKDQDLGIDWLQPACNPQFNEVWTIWSEGDVQLVPKLLELLGDGPS